ncbi:hypothetical protein HDU97_009690 [Phlyctochytrium planicorne]|nr:hypothetical protein HDU97_009690 [Phlyctochytrium planicorne]
MTPKQIANKIKCHISSEAHQRQMMVFAENPEKYLNMYSTYFKNDFLKVLSRGHGTKRVHANLVYQEYIADRTHYHMNATRWHSLAEFVKFLGREGYCEIDETEKGWFIQWIDKSPEALARQAAIDKKERSEKSEEEREARLLTEQIERAQAASAAAQAEFTELKRETTTEPIKLSLLDSKPKDGETPSAAISRQGFLKSSLYSSKPSWLKDNSKEKTSSKRPFDSAAGKNLEAKPKLAVLCLESFEELFRSKSTPSTRSFELLSRAIQVILKLAPNVQRELIKTSTGVEFVNNFITQLAQTPWRSLSITLSNALSGLELNDLCQDILAKKIIELSLHVFCNVDGIREFPGAELKDMPALVRWALTLSRKLMTVMKNLVLQSYKDFYFYTTVDHKLKLGCKEPDDYFFEVVNDCIYWDSISSNLAQFSFLLIDYGSGPASTKKGETRHLASKMANLGVGIAKRLVLVQENKAGMILEQVLSRVLSNDCTSAHLCYIITSAMKEKPGMLAAYSHFFREAINYLSTLQMDIGIANVDARKLSCQAFLSLLELAEEPIESSSQGPVWANSDDSQILYTLRKALSQQVEVRQIVYDGFKALLSTRSWMAPSMLEVIGPHFLQYFESEKSVRSPVKFDLCMKNNTETVNIEPLHLLMICIWEISQKASNGISAISVDETYKEVFSSVSERFLQCDLDDFELGNDGSARDSLAERNKLKADLVMHCFDAMILILITDTPSKETRISAEKLCAKKRDFMGKIKEVYKGKKGKKQAGSEFCSIWKLRYSLSALRLLVSPGEQFKECGEETLKWLFHGASKILSEYHKLPSDEEKEELWPLYGSLMLLFLREYSKRSNRAASKNQKIIQAYMAESIHGICTGIAETMPNRLVEILIDVTTKLTGKSFVDSDSTEVVNEFFDVLKEIIQNLLLEENTMKDVQHLFSSIEEIAKAFFFRTPCKKDSERIADVVDWLKEFCYTNDINETGIAKSCANTLGVFLKWTLDLEKLVECSNRLLVDMGTVLEDMDVKDEVLAGMRSSIVPTWFASIVSSIDEVYEVFSWLISQFGKLDVADGQEDEAFDDALGELITTKITLVLQALSTLQQGVMKQTQREALIRSLVKIFKVMTTLIKKKIKFKSPTPPSFIAMLEASESLRSTMNSVIPAIQQEESGKAEPSKGVKRQRNGVLATKKKRSAVGYSTLLNFWQRPTTESKTMPALIFQIELFEKFVISLNKKSKRSTGRDFKIDEKKLDMSSDEDGKGFETDEVDDEEMEDDEEEEDEE